MWKLIEIAKVIEKYISAHKKEYEKWKQQKTRK